MKIKTLAKLAIAAAATTSALPAMAAVTLTAASVRGPTNTVWDTATGGFYTMFLSNPFGTALNPNDNFAGYTIAPSTGDFDIAGDGWPTSTTNPNQPATAFNSDPFYTLSVTLSDGATTRTLSGVYTVATNVFTTTDTARLGGTLYSISGFNWDRSKRNIVGAYTVAGRNNLNGPGSAFDYQGTFGLAQAAVPEPATWAMMIVGFGAVGFASRRRRGMQNVYA